MIRSSAVLALCLILIIPSVSSAQREPPRTAPVQTKVTGPVKGAPRGSTFVIATRKGTTTVDASKATVRHKGRFANVAMIKPGTFVQSTGTLSGSTLMASEVNIIRLPGASTAPKAPKPPK